MSDPQREASSGMVVQTIHLFIIFCFLLLIGYEILVLISSFWTPTTRSSVRNICVLSLFLLGYLGSVHLANRWFDELDGVDRRRPFFTWLEGGAGRWWKEQKPLNRLGLRLRLDNAPVEEPGSQVRGRGEAAWLSALRWLAAFLAGQQLADSRSDRLDLRIKTGGAASEPGRTSGNIGVKSIPRKRIGPSALPAGALNLAVPAQRRREGGVTGEERRQGDTVAVSGIAGSGAGRLVLLKGSGSGAVVNSGAGPNNATEGEGRGRGEHSPGPQGRAVPSVVAASPPASVMSSASGCAVRVVTASPVAQISPPCPAPRRRTERRVNRAFLSMRRPRGRH